MLRNFPTENLSEKGSALLHESYSLIKNVLQLTENVNTIDGKLKDPAKILTLHNSVRKTWLTLLTTQPGQVQWHRPKVP